MEKQCTNLMTINMNFIKKTSQFFLRIDPTHDALIKTLKISLPVILWLFGGLNSKSTKKIKESHIHLHYFPTFEDLKKKIQEAMLKYEDLQNEVLALFGFYRKIEISKA